MKRALLLALCFFSCKALATGCQNDTPLFQPPPLSIRDFQQLARLGSGGGYLGSSLRNYRSYHGLLQALRVVFLVDEGLLYACADLHLSSAQCMAYADIATTEPIKDLVTAQFLTTEPDRGLLVLRNLVEDETIRVFARDTFKQLYSRTANGQTRMGRDKVNQWQELVTMTATQRQGEATRILTTLLRELVTTFSQQHNGKHLKVEHNFFYQITQSHFPVRRSFEDVTQFVLQAQLTEAKEYFLIANDKGLSILPIDP